MDRLKIRPHYNDQMQVMYYGKRIAYCSRLPNMPVCFLRLRAHEDVSDHVKADALELVEKTYGPLRYTKEMMRYKRDEPGRSAGEDTDAASHKSGPT